MVSPYLAPDDIYNVEPPLPNWRWKGRIVPNSTAAARTVNWDALLIEDITLPNGSVIPSRPFFFHGRNRFLPDFTDVSAVQATFYETHNGDATVAVAAWGNLVVSNDGPNTFYGLPVEYQQTLEVDLFGYGSSKDPVLSYTGTQVWIPDPGSLNLVYTGSDRVKVQVTLQCNNILIANRLRTSANLSLP